jgi:HEPN domain-containing protein
MFDINKHILYWRDGATKDLQFADRLIKRDQEIAYGLFFVHLALEKAIKACVSKQTKQVPPRIHNLLVLAKLAEINLSQEQSDYCTRMNLYNIEGRYPDMYFPLPSLEKAKEYLALAKEMIKWLLDQL